MIAEVAANDYSACRVHAYGRRLRLAAYYDIRRNSVRDLRMYKMWTQQQLADAAGVSKQTITRMESSDGKNIPQFDTIKKVAKALGTDAPNLVVYHTPENERGIDDAQRDWEERNEGNDEPGNRGA